MNSDKFQGNKSDLSDFNWIHKPGVFSLDNNCLTIITDPGTDYWQRTYYGFQNDNAPTFVKAVEGDFTFIVKTCFDYVNQYDQCGIVLYHDSENWIKASIEYENKQFARLGSVVTNFGFSDWASADISAAVVSMWYRFSRRGQDFYVENSSDGINYQQMRLAHMHKPISVARVGVYACSPGKSSFKADFSDFALQDSINI